MITRIVSVLLNIDCQVAFEPSCFHSDSSLTEQRTARRYITAVTINSR